MLDMNVEARILISSVFNILVICMIVKGAVRDTYENTRIIKLCNHLISFPCHLYSHIHQHTYRFLISRQFLFTHTQSKLRIQWAGLNITKALLILIIP